jgi:hypothetical protein
MPNIIDHPQPIAPDLRLLTDFFAIDSRSDRSLLHSFAQG